MTQRNAGSEDYKGATLSLVLRSEVKCGEAKAWLSYGAITVHLATGLSTFHSYHSPDSLNTKTDVREPLDQATFTEDEKCQILKLMEVVYEQIFVTDKKT